MRDRWGTVRLEAFSDGVFAIAATLLVLDIGVPASKFDDLWRGILDQWPSYLAYATSFITIGGLWLLHHGVFRRLAFADNVVTRLNLLLLMSVAFLPFPTRLVAEAIDMADAERAAVIFYGASLLTITLLTNAMWRYVARNRDLLEPGVSERDVKAVLDVTTPNVGFYAFVIALAILAPRAAAFGYLVVALLAVVRVHGDSAPDKGRNRPA